MARYGGIYMPQWSPPVNGGSTPGRVARPALEFVAAMEPPVQQREQGSQIPGPLTCANRSSREWSGPGRALKAITWICQGAKIPADLHASAPRLLSHHLGARVQRMAALDEGSFSWWPGKRRRAESAAWPRLIIITLSSNSCHAARPGPTRGRSRCGSRNGGAGGLWRVCRRSRVAWSAAGGGGLNRAGAWARHCASVMAGTNCHLSLPYCVSTELGMEEEQ